MTTASAELHPAETTSQAAKWAIALFFVVLFIPGYIHVGVRIHPYRLYLLVMTVPMVIRFLRDPTIRITFVDVIILLAISWKSLSIVANHGTRELFFTVSSFVELSAGYLIGRVFIRSAADFRFFFKCFLITLLAFLPFALVESLTHQRLLRNLAATVLIQPEEPHTGQVRFGLLRTQLSFDHALIFGGFCAVGFANVFYIFRRRFPRGLLYALFVAAMTALAISTSSIIGVVIQAALIVYDRFFRFMATRWMIFAYLLVMGSVFAAFIPFREILDLVFTEFMYSPWSGPGRLLHYEYGMEEIRRHPLFGVGLNTWGSPFWLSQALDSFWLATALMSGVPAVLFLVAAFAIHFLNIAFAANLNEEETDYRIGYLISFFATMVMLHMVSFYSLSLVFFMMYCGAGAWFYDMVRSDRAPGSEAPRRPDRRTLVPRGVRPPRDARAAGGAGSAPPRIRSRSRAPFEP